MRLVSSVLKDLSKDLELLEFQKPSYKESTQITDEFQRRKKRLECALLNSKHEFEKQSNSNWIRPNSKLIRWFELQRYEIESIIAIIDKNSNDDRFQLNLIEVLGKKDGNLYPAEGDVKLVLQEARKLSKKFSQKAEELDLLKDYLPFSS